jgi:hypothetical protein
MSDPHAQLLNTFEINLQNLNENIELGLVNPAFAEIADMLEATLTRTEELMKDLTDKC